MAGPEAQVWSKGIGTRTHCGWFLSTECGTGPTLLVFRNGLVNTIGLLYRRGISHIEGSHPDKLVKIRAGCFPDVEALDVEGGNGFRLSLKSYHVF